MFTFVANPPNLANRGAHSYVNVAGSRLAGTAPDLPFVQMAGISDECLPIYVLEGIYGRMVVLDADPKTVQRDRYYRLRTSVHLWI